MPWTWLHFVTYIPCLTLYILSAILIGKWLKNKDENVRLIPIHIISAILIILEIIKQIKSFSIGYQLDDLPLYYCSLFLYLFPLCSLGKGKLKKYAYFLTILSGTTLLAVMCIMPRVIYSENAIKNFFNDFDDFHTVFYHNIVLFGTCLLFTLNLLDLNIKHKFWCALSFYLSYCIIVIPIALSLKVNFNQFYNSNIPLIEELRLQQIEIFGFGGQILYDIEATITTVGFSLIMYFILKFVMLKIQKRTKKSRDEIGEAQASKIWNQQKDTRKWVSFFKTKNAFRYVIFNKKPNSNIIYRYSNLVQIGAKYCISVEPLKFDLIQTFYCF